MNKVNIRIAKLLTMLEVQIQAYSTTAHSIYNLVLNFIFKQFEITIFRFHNISIASQTD